MKVEIKHGFSQANFNVATTCPHCNHNGTFLNVTNGTGIKDFSGAIQYVLGIKMCPNTNCNGHLFFIANRENVVFVSPSQTIPFDKENIPENVLKAFDEAVRCHSNDCFVASAIMIRKTLEEICQNRDSRGNNLYEKLKNLGGKILIPKELIDAMDELRLLGNDAAHIEAQTFSEIGKDEIEISIEFTKEILKAVYQYESLLTKLKSLKKGGDASETIADNR